MVKDCNPQLPPELNNHVRLNEELELVQAACAGDVEAFGKLYQKNSERVYRYIAYRVRTPAEAEDLTAQVFLNAWKAISRYKPQESPFLAWLYTISHNQVINYVKSRGQNTAFTSIDTAYELVDNNRYNSPDEQTAKLAEYEELRQAILHLPTDQQHVIFLRYVEELGHAEIGQMLGKPEVTVRGILFRAHEGLRKFLKRESTFG
ncbi:MAG: polymerase sigma-70 factor, subfamily [Chloroflexi bacterium]|nr:polymerase sigma-70 factor, subfamily [Chloroflexota bacterium]